MITRSPGLTVLAMDGVGTLYGLTTNAWTRSAIAIATTTVKPYSMIVLKRIACLLPAAPRRVWPVESPAAVVTGVPHVAYPVYR